MSMTVNTGCRTQISANFMARFLSAPEALWCYRSGRTRRFLNEISIVQLPACDCSDAVSGLKPFRNLEAPPLFVLTLPRRPYLALVDTIPINHKNLVYAITVTHGSRGNGDCFFCFFAGDRCLHKKTGLQTCVVILNDRLRFKGARVL